MLLNSIGVAQWTVLRGRVPRAGWWIAANAAGWLAGLTAVFAGTAFVGEGDPAWKVGAIAVASRLAMGAIAAAATGLALVRLLRPAPGRRNA